jgi:hypothetical protein
VFLLDTLIVSKKFPWTGGRTMKLKGKPLIVFVLVILISAIPITSHDIYGMAPKQEVYVKNTLNETILLYTWYKFKSPRGDEQNRRIDDYVSGNKNFRIMNLRNHKITKIEVCIWVKENSWTWTWKHVAKVNVYPNTSGTFYVRKTSNSTITISQ